MQVESLPVVLNSKENSMRINWDREEDNKLHQIMKDIHESCVEHGNEVDQQIMLN